jgi:hypothetical protein
MDNQVLSWLNSPFACLNPPIFSMKFGDIRYFQVANPGPQAILNFLEAWDDVSAPTLKLLQRNSEVELGTQRMFFSQQKGFFSGLQHGFLMCF